MHASPKQTPPETPEAKARPLRRDAEENRRRLLAAAGELFAESGFEATMDEIAKRAGLGVGTAYRRFANKDELIGALFEDRIAKLVAVADEALEIADPWEGLIVFLEQAVELQARDRGLKELLFSSPRSREYVGQARLQIKPRVDALVERAQRAGRLREGIEATDLALIQLMLSGISDLAREQDPELWRRFLPLFITGLSVERSQPLPGRALSSDELEAAIESA